MSGGETRHRVEVSRRLIMPYCAAYQEEWWVCVWVLYCQCGRGTKVHELQKLNLSLCLCVWVSEGSAVWQCRSVRLCVCRSCTVRWLTRCVRCRSWTCRGWSFSFCVMLWTCCVSVDRPSCTHTSLPTTSAKTTTPSSSRWAFFASPSAEPPRYSVIAREVFGWSPKFVDLSHRPPRLFVSFCCDLKTFLFSFYWHTQHIRGFAIMHYCINLLLTLTVTSKKHLTRGKYFVILYLFQNVDNDPQQFVCDSVSIQYSQLLMLWVILTLLLVLVCSVNQHDMQHASDQSVVIVPLAIGIVSRWAWGLAPQTFIMDNIFFKTKSAYGTCCILWYIVISKFITHR